MTPAEDVALGVAPDVPLSDIALEPEVATRMATTRSPKTTRMMAWDPEEDEGPETADKATVEEEPPTYEDMGAPRFRWGSIWLVSIVSARLGYFLSSERWPLHYEPTREFREILGRAGPTIREFR